MSVSELDIPIYMRSMSLQGVSDMSKFGIQAFGIDHYLLRFSLT